MVSLATALHERDILSDFPIRDDLFGREDWVCDGDAVVMEPFGGPIADP